jgi:hypothetical protein
MGIYIYTMRAKTVPLVLPFGQKVEANLYSYAYRYSSMWKGDYGYRGYTLTEANAKRNAENVFSSARSGPVIMGDIKTGLEGCSVYVDVTAGLWYDTDKFPGTLIGWTKKLGRGYVVADRTEWSKGTKALRGETWVPIRTRSIMIDGKATYQSEDISSENSAAPAGI